MKISELSRRSGVPLATVKFYLRERLLPAGAASGPNQAEYGPEHLRRLALIRTLKDVGGLSIAQLRQVIAVVEQPDASVWQALGAGIDALSMPDRPTPATDLAHQCRREPVRAGRRLVKPFDHRANAALLHSIHQPGALEHLDVVVQFLGRLAADFGQLGQGTWLSKQFE